MSKSAQAIRQTLFFVFDGDRNNKAASEGEGEASPRQKQVCRPTACLIKHQKS
jgi:hypothetical protein